MKEEKSICEECKNLVKIRYKKIHTSKCAFGMDWVTVEKCSHFKKLPTRDSTIRGREVLKDVLDRDFKYKKNRK